MSQPDPSSSSSFQSVLNKAVWEYEKRTGIKLEDHPPAKQLDACDSVESITSVIQEQARAFHEFRGDDGRVMKSLKGAVGVLYTPSSDDAFSEGISLAFPPARAAFAGFAILLAAVKDVSASYDALIDLFESIENFLSRLGI